MLRLVIIIILAYLFYRLVKGIMGKGSKVHRTRDGGVIDEMIQDPQCKTYIPSREAVRRFIGGEELLFCSDECADKFKARVEGDGK